MWLPGICINRVFLSGDIHEHELSATDESHAFRSHAFQAAGLTKVVQEFGLCCSVQCGIAVSTLAPLCSFRWQTRL